MRTQVRFIEVADAVSPAPTSARGEPAEPPLGAQESRARPSAAAPVSRDAELVAKLATFRNRYETLAREHDKQRRRLQALAAELESSQHEPSPLRSQGGDDLMQHSRLNHTAR